jgi:hypothetical protein
MKHTSLLIKLTRVYCTTLVKLTTDIMTTFLREKTLDYREREREKNERDTMLLLQEPTKNICEASNI